MPRLRMAAAAGDRAALLADAHALRGMAGNFGLSALAEALAALEKTARAAEEGVAANLAEVEVALASALETLAGWQG